MREVSYRITQLLHTRRRQLSTRSPRQPDRASSAARVSHASRLLRCQKTRSGFNGVRAPAELSAATRTVSTLPCCRVASNFQPQRMSQVALSRTPCLQVFCPNNRCISAETVCVSISIDNLTGEPFLHPVTLHTNPNSCFIAPVL